MMFTSAVWNFILSYMELIGVFIIWSKFNYSSKNNVFKYIGLSLIICSINNILSYFEISYTFFINYCLTIVFVSIVFRKKLKTALLEFVIVIIITMVLQFIIFGAFTMIGKFVDSSLIINEEFKGLIINIFMLILICGIKKYIPYNKVFVSNISMQIIFFYLINAFIYVFIIKSIWESDYTIIEKNIAKFIIVLLIYIFVNVGFLKELVFLIEEKKSLEAYNRYSKLTVDLVNDVKSKQHDFKNHLSTIYGIVQVSNEEDSREKIKYYIEGLSESLLKEQNLISLDNKVLAGIIYSKLQKAEELEINFRYSINSDISLIPVKDYELAEILFNLLDNAFDAVSNLEDKRWVELNIDKEKENSIIHIKNSGATLKNTNINEIFKKGFSTKGSQRGFGLYNIKSIVDKYGGSIEITTQNDSTEFILLFH
ncbi:sensor histidine kinase [Clostridium intestinale]|uniref:Two-component system, AgrA family, sensor histidine kinase AgrC n=1 Tax=Clostridium intestinale DSM 6191 TaxID=1121320 RepID=A0A1M6BUB9_9CLOT|nr:GHKL domain-containing protein [Clostridium intestinale]SHI52392.1 two-component system, AgrA family, sensor histidine kinase AgrC [Clostridium intestinale DSM 6191]